MLTTVILCELGDDPLVLAKRFVRENGLNANTVPRLETIIREQHNIALDKLVEDMAGITCDFKNYCFNSAQFRYWLASC